MVNYSPEQCRLSARTVAGAWYVALAGILVLLAILG